MTDAEINDAIRCWSASLPLRAEGGHVYATNEVRPWNGRRLHPLQAVTCADVFNQVFGQTRDAGKAAQAAYEWLSEFC